MLKKIKGIAGSRKFRRWMAMVLLVISSLVFVFLVFRNIPYPLLWNDEAETVMYGKRVLQFGYPKTTDGKNNLYVFDHPDPNLALKKESQAYIGTSWGHFYLATIGIKLAELTGNLYLKTALLRMPFAIIGYLGLVLLLASALNAISGFTRKIFFSTLFLVIAIFSVSLILHLKEVRYYAIIIFLFGWLINEYFLYHFYKKHNYWRYLISTSLAICFILFTFYPVYFVAVTVLFINLTFKLIVDLYKIRKDSIGINIKEIREANNRKIRRYFFDLLPVIASVVISIPYFIYFNFFHISAAMTAVYQYDFTNYIDSIFKILKFFVIYEFLLLAIFSKLVYWIIYFIKGDFADKKLRKFNFVSNYYLLFFVIYILIISGIPYFFERHFIVLEPVIILMILIDSFGCIYLFSKFNNRLVLIFKIFFLLSFGLILISGSSHNFKTFKNYLYELNHKYQGPLDYLIPFLKEKFPDSSNLIIATNYEENSYRYYLNSKVIIGYFGSNNPERISKDDLKITPDVIIFRKSWGHSPDIFIDLQKRAEYELSSFPVYDYQVNNISEFTTPIKHQFKILNENEPLNKVMVFTKKYDY